MRLHSLWVCALLALAACSWREGPAVLAYAEHTSWKDNGFKAIAFGDGVAYAVWPGEGAVQFDLPPADRAALVAAFESPDFQGLSYPSSRSGIRDGSTSHYWYVGDKGVRAFAEYAGGERRLRSARTTVVSTFARLRPKGDAIEVSEVIALCRVRAERLGGDAQRAIEAFLIQLAR